MTEAINKLFEKALKQGYQLKQEMGKQGIIDAQIELAIKNRSTYREFTYKGVKFAVKLTGWGDWNLYEIADGSK